MKKLNKTNPFANLVLDKEEQFLEEALERGGYVEDPNFAETKVMIEEAAIKYLHKINHPVPLKYTACQG